MRFGGYYVQEVERDADPGPGCLGVGLDLGMVGGELKHRLFSAPIHRYQLVVELGFYSVALHHLIEHSLDLRGR